MEEIASAMAFYAARPTTSNSSADQKEVKITSAMLSRQEKKSSILELFILIYSPISYIKIYLHIQLINPK